MPNQPTLDLPIQYQTLSVDIEPVAALRNFGEDAYDVANVTAVVQVNSPAEQEYRLIFPFAVEDPTRAFVRVVSAADEDFDITAKFEKLKGKADELVPLLQKMGWLTQEQTTIPPEMLPLVEGFKEARIKIPAGPQLLRIHASKKLLPLTPDRRSYSIAILAPLVNFILGGGQTNLTVNVVFPPSFQVPNLQVEAGKVEALPNQPHPALVSGSDQPVQLGDCKAFAWHWKNDPKITINYRYQ